MATPTVSAKSENQKSFIRSVVENDITFVDGVYGSGKSYISLGIAAQWLIQDRIDKILISRPIIECGREFGALPGHISEKTEPYFKQHIDYLDKFLTRSKSRQLIKNDSIELMPVELLRGTSYKNTFMILDEAQNCTVDQIILFLTRMDENSKLLMMGDSLQCDIRYNHFKEIIKRQPKDVSIIKLGEEDILRNKRIYGICKEINGYFYE